MNNHCRLCASVRRNLQPVNTELVNQINLLLHVGINLNEDDKLPKQICRRCQNTVNNSWIFFAKVHAAQEKLEDCVKYDIKLEECSNTSIKDENVSTENKLDEITNQDVVTSEDQLKLETCGSSVKSVDDEEMLLVEGYFDSDSEPLDPSESWPDYPWICSICTEKCGDVRGYTKHHCFLYHERYFCMDCPKAYSRPVQLFAHVSEQHWHRLQCHLLLRCDICQIWFHTREKQEEHRKDEHPFAEPRSDPENKIIEDNRLTCPLCCKSFTSRSNLNSHQKIHTGMKEFKCEECGKSYSRKGVYLNHKRIHLGGKEFSCDQCGKAFNQRCNLEEHMSLHSNDRPYGCSMCSRCFKTKRCLRRHLAAHSMAKPYVCEICSREFKLQSSLRDHLRNHADFKEHECEFCGKAFGLKKVLQVHRRIHTGEQPYRCMLCEERFTAWGHWRQHMKKTHAEIVEEHLTKPECNG